MPRLKHKLPSYCRHKASGHAVVTIDVNLVNKVILILPGKKNGKWWQPKTKFGTRRIAIIPELEVVLQHLRQTNKKWVFETKRGTQCHASNVEKRFRQICEGLKFQKHYVVLESPGL